MNFDEAFDRLLGAEGGYVNDARDPGGETRWGISKRAYPALNIAELTRDAAKAIYLRDYWKYLSLDRLNPAVAFQVFDCAVNHGTITAATILQKAVATKPDGVIGPITIAACNMLNPMKLCAAIVSERLDVWSSLPTWPTYSKGWARRAAMNLNYAIQDT